MKGFLGVHDPLQRLYSPANATTTPNNDIKQAANTTIVSRRDKFDVGAEKNVQLLLSLL